MKVIVVTDIKGNFKQLVKKLNKVLKKSDFDILFCIGQLFANNNNNNNNNNNDISEYIKSIPISTYIISTNNILKNVKLPSNVKVLNDSNGFIHIDGLNIMYGDECNDTNKNVDIMLSNRANNNWKMLQPQYYFHGGVDTYKEDIQNNTRIISLAPLKNNIKQKSIYACHITPGVNNLSSSNDNEPPNKRVKKNSDENKNNAINERFSGFEDIEGKYSKANTRWNMSGVNKRQLPDGYICRRCGIAGHHIRDCPQTKQRTTLSNRKDCWFCLGTTTCETHLVLSVGEFAYLALAKGILTPEHVLILPIQHVTHSLELDEQTLKEIQLYKNALKNYFKNQAKTVVFYERYIPTSNKQFHMHIQVVPMDAIYNQDKAVVKEIIKHGNKEGFEFREFGVDETLAIATNSRPYIFVEVNDQKLIHCVEDVSKRGYFTFIRRVLATLLGTPEKTDWKTCVVSQKEEETLVENFKKGFESYDFTLLEE